MFAVAWMTPRKTRRNAKPKPPAYLRDDDDMPILFDTMDAASAAAKARNEHDDRVIRQGLAEVGLERGDVDTNFYVAIPYNE